MTMELKGRGVGVMGTLALTCALLVIVGDRSVGHSELILEPGAEVFVPLCFPRFVYVSRFL